MTEKTFGQAFAEARKQGLDKFQWKGGWYSTKRADETFTRSHNSVKKGNSKQKYSKSNGTVTNRFVIRDHGKQGFSVYDNEIGRYVGGLHKDKESAAKYLNSEQFKIDSGEVNVTAARTKLDRKTSGYQPVDENKNFLDKQGNTRIYQERGTGRFLATDNRNNIVGYSFDPAAATADQNWGGWIAYTGSKDDLKAAGAGKLRDETNRNEVNQKSKQERDRKLDPRKQQIEGLNRLAAGTNFVTGVVNLPNHIVTGYLRASNPFSDYTFKDYVNGFKVANYWEGTKQSTGLGDIAGDYIDINQSTKDVLNIVNPMSVVSLASSYKPSQKGIAAVSHQKGQKVITNLPNEMVLTQGPSPANKGFFSRLISRTKTQPFGAKGTKHTTLELTGAPQTEDGIVAIHNNNGSNNWFNIKGVKASTHHSTIPGKPKASTFVKIQPWHVEGQAGTPLIVNPHLGNTHLGLYRDSGAYIQETPTANFYYRGEGSPNTYALGRIRTGEVVPGTSGENWNGGTSGGRLTVVNTNNHNAPAFGGITVGGGRDNQSTWYLPLGYKRGGKVKLISKKQ